jgi:hypothetical protein
LTTPPPPPPPPNAPRPRASHLKPILITLLCGVLLAAGSCFGFVSTLTSNSSNKQTLFVIGFFAGVLGVISAGVWALAAMIAFFIRAASGEQ